MPQEAKYLTRNERAALDEIKRRVSGRFPAIQFILFGSKARGNFSPDSDIDLLVITSRPLTWRENDDMIGEAYEVNLAYGVLFTVHVAFAQDWNNGLWPGLSFKNNVENDGIFV